jgi:hypothetical protein
MAAVWDLDLPDSDKIVLLALADCANDEGHCWPSVASLVRKCTKSERTIQGSIKRLADEGHLTRREVPGKGCNYTVHPHRKPPTAETAPRNDRAPQGTTHTPAAAADKPSRTINTEAKASSQRVVDAWNVVAKKHGLIVVRVLDASRRQQLRLRLKEHGEANILEAIAAIGNSKFLRGEGRESKWRPDFDFLMQPLSLRRALEGFYGDDERPVQRKQKSQEEQRDWFLNNALFLERIGRPEDARIARRKADLCVGVARLGEVAAKIVEGVRQQ